MRWLPRAAYHGAFVAFHGTEEFPQGPELDCGCIGNGTNTTGEAHRGRGALGNDEFATADIHHIFQEGFNFCSHTKPPYAGLYAAKRRLS